MRVFYEWLTVGTIIIIFPHKSNKALMWESEDGTILEDILAEQWRLWRML